MADGVKEFTTAGGVTVEKRPRTVPYQDAALAYVDMLDERRGAVLSSNYEYPAAIPAGTSPSSIRLWR